MKPPNSLRSQLWLSLFGLLTVVGLATAGFSYWYTRSEMEDFLDQQLRQFAINLDHVASSPEPAGNDASPHDAEDDFKVQVWDAAGKPLRPVTPDTDVPRQSQTGFADTEANAIRWRTYAVVTARQTVQVSQQAVVRQELAQDSALRSLIPVGITVPLSWLLLGIVINRVLGGLDGLVTRLARPGPMAFGQIPASDVPLEIRPMAAAMNDLLNRLQLALTLQRRFVADAAHELRTPLTALQLQVANLRRVAPAENEDRIADLERGIKRASSLVGQLLQVARHQSDETKTILQPIDLVELVTSSIANIVPIADHHGLDIGLLRADPATVAGEPADLGVLIANLLENAVRYSTSGGAIDVAIIDRPEGIVLTITDSGPGIAADLLERVFEPFFRAASTKNEGSGLGLAIVARIADRYGFKVDLTNRTDASGLVARVTFPRHETVTPS